MLIMQLAPSVIPVAHAGSGMQFSLPGPKVTSTTGINLVVDTYWVEGYGYRPVRVLAKTIAPSAADRDISIRFRADGRSYSRGNPYMEVESQFILPAGATQAETVISVPRYIAWLKIDWDVFVDGRYISELSAKDFNGPGSNIYGINNKKPRILLVNPKGPQRVPIMGPNGTTALSPPSPGAGMEVDATNSSLQLQPSKLPTRWVDYSALDIVYITLVDLQDLVRSRPESWEAIRRWVGTGGTLVIKGDADLQCRPWVAEALSLSQSDPRNQWKKNNLALHSFPTDKIDLSRYGRVSGNTTIRLPKAEETFTWQRIGLGEVVISSGPIYTQGRFSVPAVNHSNIWLQRHGVSPLNGTKEFWDFLIPGVGLPPVNMFWVLITIFVIVIGPVNFFVLRRKRKLHLLLITVPLCAVCVTLALFSFALVSDGLGTKVRIRSFTDIDQRRGEAVSWSRQSYYSGLAPGGGMQLPDDTVIYPLLPDTVKYDEIEYKIDWDPSQHLSRGWISSRTPVQYLVIRASDTKRGLRVKASQGRVEIQNRLDTPIKQLLLSDGSGNLHWGEAIDNQANHQLEPVDFQQAYEQMVPTFRDNLPRKPEEMDDASYRRGFRRRRYRNRVYPRNRDKAGLRTSLLERSLNDYLGDGLQLQPNTYLAIVQDDPEVPIGVSGATPSGSFHVMRGRW